MQRSDWLVVFPDLKQRSDWLVVFQDLKQRSDWLVVFQDLKQPYQGQEGGSQDSWPWFHIMDDAMQGRLYNGALLLSPAPTPQAPPHHPAAIVILCPVCACVK